MAHFTNNRSAMLLLCIKCNHEFIRIIHVGKLYCISFFVLILLTLVSNPNKEKLQSGAARADVQLHALQQNKRRERDLPSLVNNCD